MITPKPATSAQVLKEHVKRLSISRDKPATYSQFFLAHHNVKMKKTASIIQAIFDALVSNPHAIRHAPMKLLPK